MMGRISHVFSEFGKELKYRLRRPKKVLFDHLPKCGGTTINLYLPINYPKRRVYTINGYDPLASVSRFKALPQEQRQKFGLIQGHMANDLIDYFDTKALCVTVFREPIDRIVSHYYYVKRNPKHYLYERVMRDRLSLDDYCAKNLTLETRNWYVTHFSGRTISEVELNPRESVDAAYDIVTKRYDLVGFQDMIPEFMSELISSAGFYLPFKNEFKNKTKDRLGVTDLSTATSRIISEVNELDIMLFDRLFKNRVDGVVKKLAVHQLKA